MTSSDIDLDDNLIFNKNKLEFIRGLSYLKIQLQLTEHCYRNTLKQLHKRGEFQVLFTTVYIQKQAHLAGAYGLPKVHKDFDNITYFYPIIDTAGTSHYLVGKYFSGLVNPLIYNAFLPLTKDFHNIIKKTVSTILKIIYKGNKFHLHLANDC